MCARACLCVRVCVCVCARLELHHVSSFKSCLQAHSAVISTIKQVWPEVEVVFDDLVEVCSTRPPSLWFKRFASQALGWRFDSRFFRT